MDGVYNRKLFSKKSEEARNKLRQMGGVQPMPQKMAGIMASSPELMQAAAMRRPVVLPSSTTPSQQPMPAPQPQMLPPSTPLPNIAGIPQAQAPAPRPVAQRPGVKKLANGGDTFLDHYKTPAMKKALEKSTGTSFDKAFEFGQKAITTEDPTKLGLPEGANMAEPAEMLKDPETAAADIIADTVPKDQQTGDTKTDLRKAATMTGIERVPAEAEIDELNKAIFGAKLAGALAGDYVNPATGQAVRPSAGKRVAQAAVEGLAVARETEERRAKQEAALAAARIKAAAKGKTGKGFLDSSTGKSMLKMAENAIGKDLFDAAALEEFMIKAYGQEAYDAYQQALREQAAGVTGQNVPTTQEEPVVEEEPAAESTGFVPTLTLEDGTPIMLQGNKWVDAQGNDRTNG